MQQIKDKLQIDKYVKEYSFHQYFGFDIRPFTSLVRFEPDDVILSEGEPPKKLYFLLQGRAKLFMSHKNGTVDIINYLKAPCFIGEMELFDPARTAKGVTALTVCDCFCIDVAACRDKMMNDIIF